VDGGFWNGRGGIGCLFDVRVRWMGTAFGRDMRRETFPVFFVRTMTQRAELGVFGQKERGAGVCGAKSSTGNGGYGVVGVPLLVRRECNGACAGCFVHMGDVVNMWYAVVHISILSVSFSLRGVFAVKAIR